MMNARQKIKNRKLLRAIAFMLVIVFGLQPVPLARSAFAGPALWTAPDTLRSIRDIEQEVETSLMQKGSKWKEVFKQMVDANKLNWEFGDKYGKALKTLVRSGFAGKQISQAARDALGRVLGLMDERRVVGFRSIVNEGFMLGFHLDARAWREFTVIPKVDAIGYAEDFLEYLLHVDEMFKDLGYNINLSSEYVLCGLLETVLTTEKAMLIRKEVFPENYQFRHKDGVFEKGVLQEYILSFVNLRASMDEVYEGLNNEGVVDFWKTWAELNSVEADGWAKYEAPKRPEPVNEIVAYTGDALVPGKASFSYASSRSSKFAKRMFISRDGRYRDRENNSFIATTLMLNSVEDGELAGQPKYTAWRDDTEVYKYFQNALFAGRKIFYTDPKGKARSSLHSNRAVPKGSAEAIELWLEGAQEEQLQQNAYNAAMAVLRREYEKDKRQFPVYTATRQANGDIIISPARGITASQPLSTFIMTAEGQFLRKASLKTAPVETMGVVRAVRDWVGEHQEELEPKRPSAAAAKPEPSEGDLEFDITYGQLQDIPWLVKLAENTDDLSNSALMIDADPALEQLRFKLVLSAVANVLQDPANRSVEAGQTVGALKFEAVRDLLPGIVVTDEEIGEAIDNLVSTLRIRRWQAVENHSKFAITETGQAFVEDGVEEQIKVLERLNERVKRSRNPQLTRRALNNQIQAHLAPVIKWNILKLIEEDKEGYLKISLLLERLKALGFNLRPEHIRGVVSEMMIVAEGQREGLLQITNLEERKEKARRFGHQFVVYGKLERANFYSADEFSEKINQCRASILTARARQLIPALIGDDGIFKPDEIVALCKQDAADVIRQLKIGKAQDEDSDEGIGIIVETKGGEVKVRLHKSARQRLIDIRNAQWLEQLDVLNDYRDKVLQPIRANYQQALDRYNMLFETKRIDRLKAGFAKVKPRVLAEKAYRKEKGFIGYQDWIAKVEAFAQTLAEQLPGFARADYLRGAGAIWRAEEAVRDKKKEQGVKVIVDLVDFDRVEKDVEVLLNALLARCDRHEEELRRYEAESERFYFSGENITPAPRTEERPDRVMASAVAEDEGRVVTRPVVRARPAVKAHSTERERIEKDREQSVDFWAKRIIRTGKIQEGLYQLAMLECKAMLESFKFGDIDLQGGEALEDAFSREKKAEENLLAFVNLHIFKNMDKELIKQLWAIRVESVSRLSRERFNIRRKAEFELVIYGGRRPKKQGEKIELREDFAPIVNEYRQLCREYYEVTEANIALCWQDVKQQIFTRLKARMAVILENTKQVLLDGQESKSMRSAIEMNFEDAKISLDSPAYSGRENAVYRGLVNVLGAEQADNMRRVVKFDILPKMRARQVRMSNGTIRINLGIAFWGIGAGERNYQRLFEAKQDQGFTKEQLKPLMEAIKRFGEVIDSGREVKPEDPAERIRQLERLEHGA